MELQTVKKKYGHSIVERWSDRCKLKQYAARIIRYTEKSEGSKLALLFSYPGIFQMELRYLSACVRLVKEGDVFRAIERHEKPNALLCVEIRDAKTLRALIQGDTTINRALSEKRVSFRGAAPFFSVFTRICNEGDRTLLSQSKYKRLYLSEK